MCFWVHTCYQPVKCIYVNMIALNYYLNYNSCVRSRIYAINEKKSLFFFWLKQLFKQHSRPIQLFIDNRREIPMEIFMLKQTQKHATLNIRLFCFSSVYFFFFSYNIFLSINAQSGFSASLMSKYVDHIVNETEQFNFIFFLSNKWKTNSQMEILSPVRHTHDLIFDSCYIFVSLSFIKIASFVFISSSFFIILFIKKFHSFIDSYLWTD